MKYMIRRRKREMYRLEEDLKARNRREQMAGKKWVGKVERKRSKRRRVRKSSGNRKKKGKRRSG
jgi:hypothetical protein